MSNPSLGAKQALYLNRGMLSYKSFWYADVEYELDDWQSYFFIKMRDAKRPNSELLICSISNPEDQRVSFEATPDLLRGTKGHWAATVMAKTPIILITNVPGLWDWPLWPWHRGILTWVLFDMADTSLSLLTQVAHSQVLVEHDATTMIEDVSVSRNYIVIFKRENAQQVGHCFYVPIYCFIGTWQLVIFITSILSGWNAIGSP